MKTVNSLSGGKTSSYLAVHYPADINVFALCCIDCHNAGISIDPGIKKMVNDRLQKYCSNYPDFVATTEDPKVLKVIFDLEQMIGEEIIWLRGIGWEKMLEIKKAIPNKAWRFCTTILKMQPIFEHLYLYHDIPVKMRLGYRYDEKERAERALDSFEFSSYCEYQPNSDRWIHRWNSIPWRIGDFPLIENKIVHPTISKFWSDKSIEFPEDSNCLNCFWKDPAQLRKNFDTNSQIMTWALIQEEILGNRFKDELSLIEVRNLGIQMDFFFGIGSGCQAGFCTN